MLPLQTEMQRGAACTAETVSSLHCSRILLKACAACAVQPTLAEEQARTASPFKPYRPTTPQPWSGPDTCFSSDRGASAETDSGSPFDDWEVEGEALEVCRTDDGQPVILGQGSFGTVSCCTRTFPRPDLLVHSELFVVTGSCTSPLHESSCWPSIK